MSEQVASGSPTGDLPDVSGTAPTAALILIGNEILSGRTADKNLNHLALELTARGIRFIEARVIPDDASRIVSTVNELRRRCTYVFTTGGIGPTHDDITADCVAAAFDVPVALHPEARSTLQAFWAERGIEENDDRLRMARIPVGASLIRNTVSAAPGFRLENVFVFAGVPRIMQAMLEEVLPTLAHGAIEHSITVTCTLGEGTLAGPLRKLQESVPTIDIGSYPGQRVDGVFRVALVARGTDELALAAVRESLERLVCDLGGDVIAT